MRALYVTDRWDGPYRYRCQQACEQLRAEGAAADVAHLSNPELPGLVASYGVVVLFRLPYGEQVEAVVAAARRLGVPLLFDIDDLIFDPRLENLMPFRRRYSSAEWAESYGRQIAALRRTFDVCDAFIGSTPELAEHARQLGKRAHVHPNVAPQAYLRMGKWASRLSRALRVQPTIGYFSGSDTHDEDFASIAPAIEAVLAEDRLVRLLIVGHLELSGRHPEIEQRLVRLPYMHWRDFAFAYAACDVTLAPLATVNEFTSSKSALKFFEAGAFSTPIVATPVREMASAIEPGRTGWLARTRQDWTDAVTSALEAGVSARVGRAARAAVEKHHSAEAHRGELLAILSEYAVKPRGEARTPSLLEVSDERGSAGRVERALRPGRAARDILRIVRAARRELRPELDVPRLERLLDQVEIGGEARRRVTELGAYVLGTGEYSAFHHHDAGPGELPGESRARSSDPSLVSPELAVDTSRYRYIVLRLRTKTSSPSARAQIFWKAGDTTPFIEQASVAFSVATDGFDRTYIVDLHRTGSKVEDGIRHAWQRARAVSHFRIDPLDRPGSFHLGPVVLLPGAPALGDETGSHADAPVREFFPVTEEGREAFHRAIRGLTPGMALDIALGGSPEAARKALAEWRDGSSMTVERLFMPRNGVPACTVRRLPEPERPGVDIVVPVYNARMLVRACLESVAKHARGDYRIVVIDDASPDPELWRELGAFAKTHERTILLKNRTNLGFVRTANRGMRHARDRDVLLLNSDTQVSEGFLEGLTDAAYSGERVGMASPLSNNATICSIPEFCRDNRLPDGMRLDEMAALVARSSNKLRPVLVTPHGFCLYLRRNMLADIGLFDEELFGKGFGEENDLGERAKAAGYETVLADDVYVWHAGKASFGEHGWELEDRHGDVLSGRHPGYRAAVAQFVRDNPLAAVHEVVRRHLARRSMHLNPGPLVIMHASPFADDRGGVEHCVRDLVRAVAAPRVVLLYPNAAAIEVAEIVDGDLLRPSIHRFPLNRPPERFCHEHAEALQIIDEVLSLFRIGWAHIHHLMFLPAGLGSLLAERHIPYAVTVHDFYDVCPSFNLLDYRTVTRCCPASACDPARTEACQRALFETLGEPMPPDSARFVAEHRRIFQALFEGAVRVIFPSPSTAHLTGQLLDLDDVRTEVLPHGIDAPRASISQAAAQVAGAGASGRPRDRLRVALVGQVAYASKGAEAYLELMKRLSDVQVEWHVFGRTDLFGFDERLDAVGARAVRHGAYERDGIVAALGAEHIDVGVLLPPWPETYSYTLTELLSARVPVVARRIGALGDRLEGARFAKLVDDAAEAAETLRGLERDRAALAAMRAAMSAEDAEESGAHLRSPSTVAWGARHRELYAECAASSNVKGPLAATAAECARLNALVVVTTRDGRDRGVTVTSPAAAVTSKWWYKHAERAKPYVPESIRQITRRRLSRDTARPVLKFRRLPGKGAVLGQQLTLDRRYLGTTQLTSHGTDPFLALEHEPLDPKLVKVVRFNLWCSTHAAVFAQLYFRHEGAPAFDEEHSIEIPLNGTIGQWQEYVAHIEATGSARAWYDGGAIVALRFDPINVPGPIGLGELSLCAL